MLLLTSERRQGSVADDDAVRELLLPELWLAIMGFFLRSDWPVRAEEEH
jgi:hypothetical protein